MLLAAASLLDPSAVANLVVKHVRDLCDADAAGLCWWDDAEQVLLPLAVIDPQAGRLHQVFHPGQGATGQAFETGQPVVSNHYPAGIGFPPAWDIAQGVRAVAAVPVMANGTVYGVLTLTHHRENAHFSARDVAATQTACDQVAPMLHNMRALAHAQFRLAEARELSGIIRDSAAIVQVEPVLARVCELACRMLGAEFAGIVLPSDGENRWPATYGEVSDSAGWPTSAPEWPLLSALGDGEPFVLRQVGDDPDWPLAAMPVIAAEMLRTVLAVPLLPAEGESFGGLLLGWRFGVEPSAQLVGVARTLGAAVTLLLSQASTRAALRERDELWRLTLENAPVGICLVNLDGTFRLANEALCRMLGYTEMQLLALDFEILTGPDDAQKNRGLLQQVLLGEAGETAETRCVHADGHTVWSSLSVQLVRNAAGLPAFFCAQVDDISVQRAQTAQLTYLATHDSLTGLANRQLFYSRLIEQLEHEQPTVIALLDVPGLHGLDDRFGHFVAGEVVRQVAQRLADALRPQHPDVENPDPPTCLARLASDEFAALVAGPDAVNSAERLTAGLQAAFDEPFGTANATYPLSVHIGVASAPADGGTAQALMHAADVALTRARRERRTSLRYTAEIGENEVNRRRLVGDLRDAINGNTLSMVFQPITDAKTGRLIAAEALARWTHPEFGTIGPDTFIPIAEDAGIMADLTAWALDHALAACARWQQHKPGVAVAVNLSASDLHNPSTIDVISATLSRHGLPATLLEVELTETTVMTDLSVALNALNDIATLGVVLGIDDFGTGHSSLAYLQRLPMVELKIDRSFVGSMIANKGNAAIVTMIIQLAQTLGMITVAEGVEDDTTLAMLKTLRCDRLQGYGIARPMPEEQFIAWRP
jgi:PAS domain S-box-containing protein/diguanylate cyclase (GGDEF)-like protein